MKKNILISILFIILILLSISSILTNRTHYIKKAISTEKDDSAKVHPNPVSIIFFGDGMFDRGVKNSVKKNFNDDFNQLFVNLPEIKTYDIAFLNLEGPVSEQGKNVGSKYSFRFEPRVVESLKNAGFDIVSSANNHMGDWTSTAFKDTLTHLTSYGIKYTGAGMTKNDAEFPTIFNIKDTKIGFLGFTDVGPSWLEAKENTPGILLASDPRFNEIISNAKSQVDFLVVSFHFGEEYKEHTSRQTTLAHTAIDSGADLIIGHHPHVEQATEWYKGKFIAYSLGNFIFDQYFSKETMQGLAVSVSLPQKDQPMSVTLFDVVLSKQFQPTGLIQRK